MYLIIRFMFDVNIKELKKIGEDKELDELTKKYPDTFLHLDFRLISFKLNLL